MRAARRVPLSLILMYGGDAMREKRWYDGLFETQDDALERGLRLLDTLGQVLPECRQEAVEKAKRLLIEAAMACGDASDEDIKKEALIELLKKISQS